MSRREADREDLMQEATALRQRVEMRIDGGTETVVAGFFADGRLALYFESDPVFQFDPEGRLRRAFCDGDLFRSQGSTLARLTRARSTHSTDLERHDLGTEELQSFLSRMKERLAALLEALQSNRIEVLRKVPDEMDLQERLRRALPAALQANLAPRLGM